MRRSEERILHILRRLVEVDPGGSTERLCDLSAEVVDVAGAGIMLMATHTANPGTLCASNEVSALIEDLQFTLGEGPCMDAYRQDRVVTEPDLADPTQVRWPALGPTMVEAGARALFGFPMRIGAIRLGALNLYSDHPGPLTDDQHADALTMAYVAARVVLSRAPTASDLFSELGADFHLVVHQAAGMVSVQIDATLAESLVRLRAYAFSHDVPIETVAAAVVDRQLRFGSEAR